MVALLLEPAHWLRLRWNFDDTAYIRAWQLSVLGSGAAALFIWLDGDKITALQRLIGWLPILFLPVQFTQSYGLRDSIPLSSFSFFARQRQLRNQRLGLRDTSTRFNFGNAYLVSCIVAATLGPHASGAWFLGGVVGLIGWQILASRQSRWVPLAVAMLLASSAAVAGQRGLTRLHDRITRYARGGGDGPRDSDSTETAIGALKEIKLSQEIKWRVTVPPDRQPPKLLRTIGFDKYNSGQWRNSRAIGRPQDIDFAVVDETSEGSDYYILRNDEEAPPLPPDLPAFELRGATTAESQLPLPGNAVSLRGFKLEKVESNSYGTIRISPKHPIITGTASWGGVPAEIPPDESDLTIPGLEVASIQAVANELGLAAIPDFDERLATLQRWFLQNFEYSRYATIPAPRGKKSGPTAIERFLTDHRQGHCEYFATASTLLLRASGVPTRYAVGFSVSEYDSGRDTWVVRGKHAHAWCRAWDQKRNTWVDFDATPGNWIELERTRPSSTQWIEDALLRIREDFALWRTDTENRTSLAIGTAIVGGIAFVFIGRRLWKSKHVIGGDPVSPIRFDPIRTPLHELEGTAAALLGPRPPGVPFARWLTGLYGLVPEPADLTKAISLHQRLRFDPNPPGDPAAAELRHIAEVLLRELRKNGAR